MSTDIRPAPPLAARKLTRRTRDDLPQLAHAQLDPTLGRAHSLTHPTCEPEPAIDQAGAKRPLRDDRPPQRHQRPPEGGLQPARGQDEGAGGTRRRVQEDEHGEGERGPEPADFDKEGVEEVALARKVRGGQLRRVGLREGRVGRCARRRVEQGEGGAEEEGAGIDG